jgi:outer membrane protein assembly factor BamB/predicted MPP superfamily phosphohydrolase
MQDCYLTKLILILVFFTVSITFADAPPIRFAWLTDTHVGSRAGAEDLRGAVQDINSLGGIDFVILSGDITEMGSNAELESVKTILDSLNKPYHIIPGNHDTKWSESGCTKFSELWGEDKFNFEFKAYRFIGMHQGPLMRMGDGHFAPEDLRWLDSQLASLLGKNQPIIFVSHYPIDASIDNWYEVIDRLKPFNVKVVLCGHGHRNKVLNFEGSPGVIGRSCLRRYRAHGGYNIVEIKSDSLIFFERTTLEATNPSWHGISLEKIKLSDDPKQYQRPDFSINQQYPKVKIKWKFETGFTIASTPAVWKDYVVVGNSRGTLYALLLKNGKKRWTFQSERSIFSSPEIADGKVIFGSSDQSIYCLKLRNGKLLWKYPTADAVVASPRIENNIVYIGGSDRKFRALRLESGELLWEFDGIEGFVETRPLIYQQKIIFGAWDGCLYALNQNDGTLAWKWNDGTPGNLFSPAACLPVAANDKIFIVAPDRFMTAIDSKTGQTLWRTNRHKVRESIGMAEDGQTIYARCMRDTLLAFDSNASMPELVWATPCGYGYDIDPAMPIEKNGVIYFGTKNGFLFAIDSRSGQVNYQYRVGVTVVNTVTPINNKQVVLTDMDGRIIMIENF